MIIILLIILLILSCYLTYATTHTKNLIYGGGDLDDIRKVSDYDNAAITDNIKIERINKYMRANHVNNNIQCIGNILITLLEANKLISSEDMKKKEEIKEKLNTRYRELISRIQIFQGENSNKERENKNEEEAIEESSHKIKQLKEKFNTELSSELKDIFEKLEISQSNLSENISSGNIYKLRQYFILLSKLQKELSIGIEEIDQIIGGEFTRADIDALIDKYYKLAQLKSELYKKSEELSVAKSQKSREISQLRDNIQKVKSIIRADRDALNAMIQTTFDGLINEAYMILIEKYNVILTLFNISEEDMSRIRENAGDILIELQALEKSPLI